MLISKCLCDRLCYEENEVEVSVNLENGEKVLFFEIDNENFRDFIYGDPNRGKACDVLIYYRGSNATNDIFCFVELKRDVLSESIADAVDQLISAKEGFKRKLEKVSNCNKPLVECSKRNEPIKFFSKSITWLAYVCYKSMSSPINISTYRKKLTEQKLKGKIFDNALILPENDIGTFLRENSR